MKPRPLPKMHDHCRLGWSYVQFKFCGVRKTLYLGPTGSEQARARYARFARCWPDRLGLILPRGGTWTEPRLLTHDGKTRSIARWAKLTGVKATTIRYRLDVLGWTVERALTTPTRASDVRVGTPRG